MGILLCKWWSVPTAWLFSEAAGAAFTALAPNLCRRRLYGERAPRSPHAPPSPSPSPPPLARVLEWRSPDPCAGFRCHPTRVSPIAAALVVLDSNPCLCSPCPYLFKPLG